MDLAAEAERLWAATRDEVLVLDAGGNVLGRHRLAARDLARDPTGGAWAVDGLRLWHLGEGGPQARGAALDAWVVAENGWTGGEVARDLVVGRFGPAGEERAVAAREDGLVVGLDGEGAPAFTFQVHGAARLAVGDRDGDGHDELLVAVRDQGQAWVALALP